jgi:hypothetical protein
MISHACQPSIFTVIGSCWRQVSVLRQFQKQEEKGMSIGGITLQSKTDQNSQLVKQRLRSSGPLLWEQLLKDHSMSDNAKQWQDTDRTRIRLDHDDEVQYWLKELGVSAGELEAAITHSGDQIHELRAYLGR